MTLKLGKILLLIPFIALVMWDSPSFAKDEEFSTHYSCHVGEQHEFEDCTIDLSSLVLKDGPVQIEGEFFEVLDKPDVLFFVGRLSDERFVNTRTHDSSVFDRILLSVDDMSDSKDKYTEQDVNFMLEKEADDLWRASILLRIKIVESSDNSMSYVYKFVEVPLQIKSFTRKYRRSQLDDLPSLGF